MEEFGFGFPPRIWGKKVGETVYSINAIPFGGFVKILGEDETAETSNPRSFGAKKFWPRFGVIVAGVLMNVLLAFILFSLSNFIGARLPVTDSNIAQATDVKIQITDVAKNSPAESAGVKIFDEILDFETVEATQAYIATHKGQEIMFRVRRDGEDLVLRMTPRVDPPPGEGSLGIALAKTGYIGYPIHQAVWQGLQDTGLGIWAIVKGFGMLIKTVATTGNAGGAVAGPIGIAVITGQAARLGFTYLVQFVAFISLNLAVINIVPFPALDGGRLLFLIIEKFRGKPLPRMIEQTVNTAGFALLLLLMFYITTKDVLKFF